MGEGRRTQGGEAQGCLAVGCNAGSSFRILSLSFLYLPRQQHVAEAIDQGLKANLLK